MKIVKVTLKVMGGLLGLLILAAVGLYLLTRGDYPVAATVTDDPTLTAAEINGIRLHLRAVGPENAPVIIVIHGGPGGDHRSLLGLQALTDTHRVVFYDQRGAGLSARVDWDQLSLDGYISELDTIVDNYANGQAILIGHSWGAMLASGYMGQYPDKIDRAVLIEPGFLTAAEMQEWTATSKSFLSGFGFNWAATLAGLRARHVDGPDESAANDYLVGQMVHYFVNHPDNPYHCPHEPYGAPNWRFGALANQVFARFSASEADRLIKGQDFPGPVLFMAGACDSWIGPDVQKVNVERFANSRLQIIEDAGHDVIWDKPDAAIDAIRAFLAE